MRGNLTRANQPPISVDTWRQNNMPSNLMNVLNLNNNNNELFVMRITHTSHLLLPSPVTFFFEYQELQEGSILNSDKSNVKKKPIKKSSSVALT